MSPHSSSHASPSLRSLFAPRAFLRSLAALLLLSLQALAADPPSRAKGDVGCPKRPDPKTIQLTAFGDSLLVGYKLPPQAAFPVVLERELRARGYRVSVINAAVSGDTTEDAKARAAWSVCPGSDGVLLGFVGNDILKGLSPQKAEQNLADVITQLQKRRIAILLLGLEPPEPAKSTISYDPGFIGVHRRLAAAYRLPLYPSFLKDVLGTPGLIMEDGKHPTAKGVEKIVAALLPTVEDFVRKIARDRKASGS